MQNVTPGRVLFFFRCVIIVTRIADRLEKNGTNFVVQPNDSYNEEPFVAAKDGIGARVAWLLRLVSQVAKSKFRCSGPSRPTSRHSVRVYGAGLRG